MKSKALMTLFAAVVITLFLGVSPDVYADSAADGKSQLANAVAVKERHENALMSLGGVQGVGIGEENGELSILVLVDEENRQSFIPTTVESMPVIVRAVGKIKACQINLGTIVGNGILCPGPCDGFICNYCATGTSGYKVCDNTAQNVGGWITNNHVATPGCPGLCPNIAPIGTNLFELAPGCTNVTNVGTLDRFVTLVLDGPGGTNNPADAAFVQATDAQVTDTIQGLGAQGNTVVAPFVGQVVCKSGQTSGVTCGTVTGVNMTIDVGYDQAGDPSPGTCGTGTFNNQIMYSPTPPDTTMSDPGDSGAPVVDGSNNAVALNFAGDTAGNGYGTPMATVLTELQVSLCSDIPEPPVCDAGGPYSAGCTIPTVSLDGTGSNDPDPGDTIGDYLWTTDCPGGSFDDPASPTPLLSVDPLSGCHACGVSLTVTDTQGNTSSCSATVEITDTLHPAITCPADTPVECDASTDPADTGSATATDLCDPDPTIAYFDATAPGACPQESVITRTWTATDNCGNTSLCEQTIDVVDTTPPDIECNAPATISPPDAPISFTASAADNCDGASSVEITGYDCFFYTRWGRRIDKTESCIVEVDGDTITVLDVGGVGDHITWTIRAVDDCGNAAESECEVLVIRPSSAR